MASPQCSMFNVSFLDVIHIEGPSEDEDDDDLARCYTDSLSLMVKQKLRSIVSLC